MDAQSLKNLQAPIKATYREDPDAAVVTLKAEGVIGEGVSCSVDTGRALVEAGLHPATGRFGSPGLFRRHAARSAGRLRRRHA